MTSMNYFYKIKYFFIFLSVILSGFPILTLSTPFLSLRTFSFLLLVILVIFEEFYTRKVNFNIFIFFLFSYIYTSFYGVFLDISLFFANISNMKTIFLLIIFFSFSKFGSKEIVIIKKAVYIVSFSNVIWGVLQFIWEYFGINTIPLNNIVFYSLLDNPSGRDTFATYTYMSNSLITQRLTGFSWDPFYLGFFSNILIITSKNKLARFLGLFTLFFSYSRTNWLGFFVCFLFFFFYKINKTKKYRFLIYFFICFVPLIATGGLFLILNSRGTLGSEGDLRRMSYYMAPFEIFSTNPGVMLFGGSPIYGGSIYNIYSEISKNYYIYPKDLYWTIESDVGNILLGRGIFGFLVYILTYLNVFRLKISVKDKLLCFVLFVSGIGYGITQQPLVLFYTGALYMEAKNRLGKM